MSGSARLHRRETLLPGTCCCSATWASSARRRWSFTDSGESGLDVEDLVQEGCIGLLSAVDQYDAGKGASFLTYAAPAIRNAMTDCVRAAISQFERRLEFDGLQRVYLDDVLDADERLLRIESIADPNTQTPEQVVLRREQIAELYAGLGSLTAREQTWLLYRYGFTDGTEHPLTAAAQHFHLSEHRAKNLHAQSMDDLWLELRGGIETGCVPFWNAPKYLTT